MKRTAEGRHLKDDASNYDSTAYTKPSVTVDICICSIIKNDLKILLIKRKYSPFKDCWAIPGGFVDITKEETLEETAIRELKEKTGLKNIYIEQLKTYGDPDRDPRMRIITVAYFALLPYNILEKQDIYGQDDAKEARWFSLRRIPKNTGFDHRQILKDLLERLKGKISYTNIAFSLVPEEFTWNELQKVYEIILNKKLLNFRRKMQATYVFKEVCVNKMKRVGRPSVTLKYIGNKEIL